MPSLSNSRKGLFVVARCSVVLLLVAVGGPAIAHGGGHGDGNHFSSGSSGKSSGTNGSGSSGHARYHSTLTRGRAPLRKSGAWRSAVVSHPRKIRPPIVKPGSAKAPPFYICPGCANPNLPQGTPITEEGGGMHCTFINGLNSGCDPNIPDTGVHGTGGPGQGRHHLN